jgi:hypothetical protein
MKIILPFAPACALLLFALAPSWVAAQSAKPPAVLAAPTPPPALAAPVPPTTPEPTAWDKTKDKASDALDYGAGKWNGLKSAINSASLNRARTPWSVTANYAFLEMWVLTKYGLTVARNESAAKTYELEYMTGSLGIGYFGVDIGKIEEQRLALMSRSFSERNSFSWFYGAYINQIQAHLGNDYLATVPGVTRSSVELMELQTLGATFGIGNRWQLKNGFTWGVDWLSVHWPLMVLQQDSPFIANSNDPSKRNSADDAMDVFKRLPSFGAFKLQLGYSF